MKSDLCWFEKSKKWEKSGGKLFSTKYSVSGLQKHIDYSEGKGMMSIEHWILVGHWMTGKGARAQGLEFFFKEFSVDYE